MDMLTIIEKVGMIFVLILIGFVFGKLVRSTEKDTHLFSKLVLNVAVPTSIIASVSAADFDAVKHDFGTLVIIAPCVLAATFVCALLMTRMLRMERARAAVYSSSLMFNNYIFMGWPICALLFDQGLLYAVLYAIPMHLILFTITPIFLGTGQKRFDMRLLINLPLIATVAAVLMLVMRLSLPAYVADIFRMVGGIQTPLSMVIIGMILSAVRLKELVLGLPPYIYSAIRLLLIPAAVFFVLKALGFSGTMLGVPVVIAAMPAGTLVVILAQKYDADAVLASRLVIISTLLSIVTIPLFAMLALS